MSNALKAVIGVVVILLVAGVVFYSRYSSSRAHQQLLHFRASLTVGLPQDQVEQIFRAAQYDRLTLSHERQELWIVSTPTEFGGSNWRLHLLFSDQSLIEISVRSIDDPTQRPPRAPADIKRGG